MGIFDFIQGPNASMPIEPGKEKSRIVPAHVLEVCMSPDSSLYENPMDIGKIRYRDVGNFTPFRPKVEQELTTVAWPMDRASMRYPLPGEQVIVFEAFGDVKLPFADALQRISFYTFNVNTTHNVSYNSIPFLQSNTDLIEKNRRVAMGIAKKRFEKKLIDDDKFLEGDTPKIYPQLRPLEGDFIMQGRFGNSIRLGSTSQKEYNKQNKGEDETPAADWNQVGTAGDPIIVIRVNKETVDNPDSEAAFVMEDPTVDQASFYLCSSQNVPMLLSCTAKMKSWKATYDIGPDTKLEKMESDSKLYEQVYSKVVEMDKDVHEQINDPAKGDPTTNAVDEANTPFAPDEDGAVESTPTEAEAATPQTEFPDAEVVEQ
jgi:hypothetical protein